MANPKRIVVLGAGYGGTYTFKKLHKRFHADPKVELRLVNKINYFLSTPLLHEVATGGLSPEHIIEPLRHTFDCSHEQFLLADVNAIALDKRVVSTSRGEVLYDYLVIALGAETNYRGVPGAIEHSFPLKTLEDAIRLKNHFIATFEKVTTPTDLESETPSLHFVVVGGGATGVELAAEMADFFYETFAKFYDKTLMSRVKITILHAGDDLLQSFQRSIRVRSKHVLRKKGIEVRLGVQVAEVRPDAVILNTGEIIPTRTVIWTAGVQPSTVPITPPILREHGRIVVNECLQVASFPEVFVLGDLAAFRNSPDESVLPMLAQVAHRESVGAAGNLIRLIEGKVPMPYTYKHFGDLVSLGEWMAAGELFRVKLFGHLTWFLWRGVYLSKLLSPAKKLEVLLDWIIDLFLPRDISTLYQGTDLESRTPSGI